MEFLRPPEPMNAGKETLLCLNALQYFFCILLFLYTFALVFVVCFTFCFGWSYKSSECFLKKYFTQ